MSPFRPMQMDGGDRLSLFVFGGQAEQLLPLTGMDSEGAKQVKAVVSRIGPGSGGGTDFVAALEAVIDQARPGLQDGRRIRLIVLSDGLDGSADYLLDDWMVLSEYKERGMPIDSM